MGMAQRLTGLSLLLVWTGCAHLPAAAALQAGTYDLAALRSRLAGQEVELTPAGSAVAASDGTAHSYSAQGSLALGRDGTCLLVIEVRVDDAAPGHSERPCTWHAAGDLVSLVDAGGTATLYRVRYQDGHVVLEAVAGPAGEQEGPGERLVLEPQQVSEALARQREGLEGEQPEANDRGTRRP